ncbi:MAG: DUF3303 domain-containing protein [Alphaproteobacteria bacterium]
MRGGGGTETHGTVEAGGKAIFPPRRGVRGDTLIRDGHNEETAMLFMVVEKFRSQDGGSVYRRFRDKGRMMPEGLTFLGSWVAADLGRCFQVMECGDVTRLQQWVTAWSDLIEFEIVPVVPGNETAEALSNAASRSAES